MHKTNVIIRSSLLVRTRTDSFREVSAAIKDSQAKFKYEDSKVAYFRVELFELFPEGWKPEVEEVLTLKSNSQLKAFKQTFQKTLKHFQAKSLNLNNHEKIPVLETSRGMETQSSPVMEGSNFASEIPSITIIPPTPV
jgi:hypothetical protein